MTDNSLQQVTLWLWDNDREGLHINMTTNFNLPTRKDWFFSFSGEQTKNSWRAYNRSQPVKFQPWFEEQKQKYRSEVEDMQRLGDVYISKQVRNTKTDGRSVAQGFIILCMPFNSKNNPFFMLVMKDKEFLGQVNRSTISAKQANNGCLGMYEWKEESVDPLDGEDPW